MWSWVVSCPGGFRTWNLEGQVTADWSWPVFQEKLGKGGSGIEFIFLVMVNILIMAMVIVIIDHDHGLRQYFDHGHHHHLGTIRSSFPEPTCKNTVAPAPGKKGGGFLKLSRIVYLFVSIFVFVCERKAEEFWKLPRIVYMLAGCGIVSGRLQIKSTWKKALERFLKFVSNSSPDF